jgi:hypothetical protein
VLFELLVLLDARFIQSTEFSPERDITVEKKFDLVKNQDKPSSQESVN